MNWFKRAFLTISLVHFAVAPSLVYASPQSQSSQRQPSSRSNHFPTYQVKIDTQHNSAGVYDRATQRMAMEIPLKQDSELRRYSPNSLNQKLKEEMSKVKGAGKAALSSSLKSLPSESAIFFIAMGAVVAGQLLTDYAHDPVAFKHHIEHQLSPIGIFGFYSFMATQGITSNVLSLYIQNPRFQRMIPYLGMAAGSFVQSYLTSLLSDPNVSACGKQMLGRPLSREGLESLGAEADPCSSAYESYVLNKKIWEFAPGIVSTLVSATLASVAESAVGGAIRLTGFDVAMLVFPGGLEFKGLRMALTKGMQISLFVSIDSWVNSRITSAWKNFFDGEEFNVINDRLNLNLKSMKANQWALPSKDFKGEIQNFRKKMTAWRQMNLADIYESHQSWQENINQLVSMYDSSHSFYGALVSEVRNVRFNQQAVKPLQIAYPLNGVIVQGLQAESEDLYFQSPKMVENWQAEVVYKVVQKIDHFLGSDASKDLLKNEKDRLMKIRKMLDNEDHMVMGQGLDWLNFSLREANQTIIKSDKYVEILQLIQQALGRPDPKFEPGRGYLMTFENSPSTGATVRGTPFYRQVGNIQTPTITEYLLMQMICGPDLEKGEAVVKTSLGFPAVFLPPQLKSKEDHFGSICQTLGRASLASSNIYTMSVEGRGNKKYEGFLNYLVENMRDSAVGTASEEGFSKWWAQQTDPQIQKAFDGFSLSYQEIVINMVKKIYNQERSSYSNVFEKFMSRLDKESKKFVDSQVWRDQKNQRDDKSSFNRGPISNSVMIAAIQEQKAYLSILESILNSKDSNSFSLQTLLSLQLKGADLRKVDSEFQKMNELLKTIKIVQKQGHEFIESSLENSHIDMQVENIQKSIVEVEANLGLGNSTELKNASSRLTVSQIEIAAECIKNLRSLAVEISMYGRIANAVSWDKLKNKNQANAQETQFMGTVGKKLNGMMSNYKSQSDH